ncbi:MAG: glycosyltransferase family 39 protein [Acidimicrobiales bacterium]
MTSPAPASVRPGTARQATLLGERGPVEATTRRDRLLVGAMVALAALLRAPNLGRAYWIDEGISVGIASHPLTQIPGLLRLYDGSPPLFYMVLHVWMEIFGTGSVGTHLLPFAVALAVTPLGYWAGKEIFGRPAGLALAALAATNPFLNWYSTETRMYPMVCALSLVALTFTVRAVRNRRRGDVAAAVLTFAALLYTHDWGIYLVGVTGAVLVVRAWRAGDRQLAWGVVGAGAAVGVLWLPWVPSFYEQARHTGAPWAVPPGIGDFFADPASTLGGTLGFAVAPFLAAGAWITRRDRNGRDGEAARLLLVIGVLTALAGWVASYLEPSWTIRYLAVVLAPLLVATAGALAPSRRGRRFLAATCVVLAVWSVVGSLLPNPNARYAKSNVAAVAAAAAPYLRPGDVVVVNQTEQLAVLAHYLPAGLTYVTPTGVPAHTHFVDWYNIVGRLQKADPCTTVAPVLAGLPTGAHVLEISPLRELGASGSAWSRAANTQVRDIDYLLGTDPSLVAARSLTQASSPRPYSAVVGELFVKIPGPTPCHLPQ